MSWLKTDDNFPEHVKMDALERACGDWQTFAAARTVWHDMGCDCARRRTDGLFVRARAHRVVRLPAEVVDRALAALVTSALFEAAGSDGYQFHDWADYQPTKADIDAEKKAKTARQNRWRAGLKARRTGGGVDGDVDASTDASRDAPHVPSPRPSTDASRSASHDASPVTPTGGVRVDGAPSRPVPSRPEEKRGETPPPSRLGTRETLTGEQSAEEARTVLEGLQKAAVGKADLRGAAGVALALGRLLVAMEATPAEIARAGDALADPSAWWRQGTAPKRVTLHDLVGYHGPEGYEGKPLGWLLAHVRAEGLVADEPPPPPPRRAPTDVATLEQRRAIIAASRARRASPTPTVAPVEVTDG